MRLDALNRVPMHRVQNLDTNQKALQQQEKMEVCLVLGAQLLHFYISSLVLKAFIAQTAVFVTLWASRVPYFKIPNDEDNEKENNFLRYLDVHKARKTK